MSTWQCHVNKKFLLCQHEFLVLSATLFCQQNLVCQQYCYVDSLEGLEELKQLQKLDLSCNPITNIEGLEELKQLQKLDLSCNSIINNTTLEELKHRFQNINFFLKKKKG